MRCQSKPRSAASSMICLAVFLFPPAERIMGSRFSQTTITTGAAMTPNFANRTLWTGDNLDILRGINSASVDLIYLDPPCLHTESDDSAGAACNDAWDPASLDPAWLSLIANRHPAVHSVLNATGAIQGPYMQAYLCMMAVRLIDMRRVLRDTGSLYLHCRLPARDYLRVLMDSIFTPQNFQDQIIWQHTKAAESAFPGDVTEGRFSCALPRLRPVPGQTGRDPTG